MKIPSLFCCHSSGPAPSEAIFLQNLNHPQTAPASVSDRRSSSLNVPQGRTAIELKLRQSIGEQENTKELSQVAALNLFTHKVLEKFREKGGTAEVERWLNRYTDTHQENEQAHDEINRIYESCVTVAYISYSREITRKPVRWNSRGLEAFLNELQHIEKDNDKVFFTSQQPTGFTPSQLLDSKPEEVFRCAFYVHPASARDERRPLYDPLNRIQSRISLSIQPEHVSSIARKLATEFGSEFDDILSRYKILSAREHGGTPDNIVIYLSKASPERAKQFAAHLKATTPPETWETYSPIGMHQFLPGIAYAESAPGASSSFGMSRARLVARAVIKHLVDKVELDAALEEALTENHYSLRNPAFVEREGLNDLLQRL